MQINPVAGRKIFEPIVNPLKKLITVDTRIDSDLPSSNDVDNYYEADHSSEDASDSSINEYSPKIIRDHGAQERFEGNSFIRSRYQREKWTSDEEEEEEEEKVEDVTTAYELDVWDDPNKLVDRLQVLIDEQNMGIITNYDEIHFILSELRNASIIY